MFPARAGVILMVHLQFGWIGDVPRASGGDPHAAEDKAADPGCSPRERG